MKKLCLNHPTWMHGTQWWLKKAALTGDIPHTTGVPYLVGGWPTPLNNMSSPVGMDGNSQSMGSHRIHVPNHQPVISWYYMILCDIMWGNIQFIVTIDNYYCWSNHASFCHSVSVLFFTALPGFFRNWSVLGWLIQSSGWDIPRIIVNITKKTLGIGVGR